MESFGNPRKFAGTARPVAQRMPVLTVIGARSPAGHRASSHTALSATPLVHQAMFDLAGVIATRSLGELVDTAALLASQPLPAADTAALADALLRVSRLADDRPEVSELDPNPSSPAGRHLVRGRAGADQPGRAQGSFLRRLL